MNHGKSVECNVISVMSYKTYESRYILPLTLTGWLPEDWSIITKQTSGDFLQTFLSLWLTDCTICSVPIIQRFWITISFLGRWHRCNPVQNKGRLRSPKISSESYLTDTMLQCSIWRRLSLFFLSKWSSLSNLSFSYLNNESVSWVRGRDSHILTVDSEVFISDDRFHSQIQKLSNLWILKVRNGIWKVFPTFMDHFGLKSKFAHLALSGSPASLEFLPTFFGFLR